MGFSPKLLGVQRIDFNRASDSPLSNAEADGVE
jgi:hypothetical protein